MFKKVLGPIDPKTKAAPTRESLTKRDFEADKISHVTNKQVISVKNQKDARLKNGAFTGAITGGAAGAVSSFLVETGVLIFPGSVPVLTAGPAAFIITGTVLGVFIGAGIGILTRLFIPKRSPVSEQILQDPGDEARLLLREEQLDISKKLMRTGNVSIHKDVLREEKTIVVPVTREELVIENIAPGTDTQDKMDKQKETIRIPISEERIEVIKHPVALNDVVVYKRQFQETERVDEIVKKEKAHLEVN
jgi:uncharacterized protein (TIGR02271 family)